MRLKFLLFTMFLWLGVINAQEYIYTDTINYLVITEYRGDNTNRTYLEITNMGSEPVQLNQFKIGHWGGSDQLDYTTGKVTDTSAGYRIPSDKVLQPGESFAFAAVKEFGPRMFAKGLEGFPERVNHPKTWEYADFLVHLPEEKGDETDIVTENFYGPFNEQWGPGMNGFFIEQHFPDGDSVVVDQVLGMFTGEGGRNLDRVSGSGYDVAGVTEATGNCVLVRRFNVKRGNLDFNSSRGVGLEDSEWIPIPLHGGEWRAPMWTMGNHGDYNLDENTLESDVIDVDFANKKLNIPWGIRRGDDIMNYFVQKPGIGWEYIMAPNADSLTHVAQTGDKLLIYVCGNDLDLQAFDIVVKEPTVDANMVVPVTNEDPEGGWRDVIDNGYMAWPRVTQHESGMDSIWGTRGGIPYATRVDSLLERLEKPANASWEIVYASGTPKPDLSNGDKLKVTAQNGDIKEYYIAVLPYRANSDSYLSSITWPDIPEFYKGIFGWVGDTIPGFGTQVFSYNVEVPLITDGIPALVAKKSDPNATLEVTRATSLSGSLENRTVRFKVIAEDDSTISTYTVVLTKEKNPVNQQPYFADPFISEVSHNWWWSGTDFCELFNPGNQPLDLSDYMLIMGSSTNPADIIANTNESNWLMRYEKYIPGYKWAGDESDWVVEPYLAEADLAVNAVVLPGDVFAMGSINRAECDWPEYPATTQLDVSFRPFASDCYTWENQWREAVHSGGNGTPFGKWHTNIIYLFKIDNDSIKKGLKPATDPNDFILIDVLGKEDGSLWTVGGQSINNPFSLRRKPEIYKGNPVVGAVLGPTVEDAEYDVYNLNYYANQGFGWPWRMRNIVSDIGKHFMYTPTQYMSTVGSVVYKVSEGYVSPQQIKGLTTGTTASAFLANVIKQNENQSLTLTRSGDGAQLAMDAVIGLNDTLTVVSADSTNTTKYVLDVTEEGLSSNALLTSSRYEITISSEPKSAGGANEDGVGSITGFEYGTPLQTIVNNVTVPAGARMDIVNGKGEYVSLKTLNFDTAYVTVTVNSDTYFDVLAENGTTRITYQLLPQSSANDAFILSDVYSVSQRDLLIQFVPRGTNTQSFLANLVAATGATMKLVDKMGYERTDGVVADDDKVVVTSANGTKTVVYHISKLATLYLQNTTYLAYILSNNYGIDQVNYVINNVSGSETIGNFYTRITPAAGATAVVVDKNGVEKTTGDINGSDMVKVTSADGKVVVMYTFGQLTNAGQLEANQIEIYPNPSSGLLNVSGVKKGQRIQVYNAVGSAIVDVNVQNNRELIDLNDNPAGLYLIVISEQNRILGKYKAVKN